MLLIITAIFGAWFYYYYALKNQVEFPLKETLTLSLAFVGSFGTLASIIFAFYLYTLQREKDESAAKEVMLKNKPLLLIIIEDIYQARDDNGQPALAIDLSVVNHNNNASSFSLNYDYLPNKNTDLIVNFDYQLNHTGILRAEENINITAYIISSRNISNPPKPEEIDLLIKAVYLDKSNNMIEDYYVLDNLNRNTLPFLKSKIITASGKFIEIK